MRKKSLQLVGVTGVISALLACALLATFSVSAGPAAKDQNQAVSKDVLDGKKVAFSRSKGNCLACHMMLDGEAPGNIAPPLIVMKSRFPDIKKLRAQIWDATARNPESSMPPFGRHRIISEKEIDQVTAFVWSL
ncbi:MAG: sulfur oxidation c-type cytochrome SoxX [Gammaproteobacteria bacterium]|nr:sulfur oxidation c-type cytochrome SoxX [Gammaproteobacteria bacterium]